MTDTLEGAPAQGPLAASPLYWAAALVRFADASVFGPILQGLRARMNDLSRGCDVDDIVSVAAISALQAQ